MSLVHILFFIMLLLSSPFHVVGKNDGDQQIQSFIVRIQNDLKPTKFTNVEEWYRETLKSTCLTANQDEGGNFGGDLLHVYKNAFHGFSARLSLQQAKLLKTKPGVIAVLPDRIRHFHTTRTPHFLGLDSYSKPKGLLKESDLGSNVVIGVLDSGIWRESPSFSDDGLGPVPSHFKGKCQGEKGSSLCNNKIVGFRCFQSGMQAHINQELEMSASWDENGHGTHMASTAAGRLRPVNASFFGYAKGVAVGIAPKARLAIYKVCWRNDCADSDILAGLDTAVEDGVDIISISLGGLSRLYFSDPVAIASFSAVEKGIFVTGSAGNYGPFEGSVTNAAPWMTTVGASTIDRNFRADLVLKTGVVLTGSSLYTGKTLGENDYFPIIYANSSCEADSLNPSMVHGKIVICDFGDITQAEKGLNVKAAGGLGVVVNLVFSYFDEVYRNLISNVKLAGLGEGDGLGGEGYVDELEEPLISTAYLTPGLSIGNSAFKKLLSYLNSTQNPTATIVFHGTEVGDKRAPVVAAFSSRGPFIFEEYSLLKPDVIAPGVDILAAWPNDLSPTLLPEQRDARRSEFNIVSGTSTSCAHVAGIAALIKGAHPDWTPAMIRSALMTTSYNRYQDGQPFLDQRYDKEATIWATGSGHVDPEKANAPGLVLDISVDDYIDYLCALRKDETDIQTIVKRPLKCGKMRSLKVWNLNYPAITVHIYDVPQTIGLKVTRTFTNVDAEGSSYSAKIISPKDLNVTVAPAELKFINKGDKQSVVVNIISTVKDLGDDTRTGWLTWTDGRHNVTIPLIVYNDAQKYEKSNMT